MSTSGSTSVAVTTWDTLKFSWEVTSQSVTNNTSTISWKMQLVSGSSGRIDSTALKNWSVTVNGSKYSGTTQIGIANNTTKTLASGSTTIAHNSNGTKTFSYSFSQQFSITFSGESIGTKSGSGSGTLTTIARKSSMTASNGTLGTAQTLTVSRQDSDFTHTITYKCGSASGTVATKSSSTSISWTPPLTLASQAPSGTNVSITFTITTYSGSTSIGSNTKTISCAIPSSVVPTVSIAVSDPMGYSGTFGGYVQGMSKFKVVVTVSGSYGSTIKTCKTTADGKSYTSTTITTDVIANSGNLTIKTTVTDSRGRTATASQTVTVLAYSVPKITSLSVNRCDASGKSNSSGAYLSVVFSSSITSLNSKNTATYSVQYKKTTATTYTTQTLSNYAGQYSVSGGVFVFAADTASSYDVILTVSDKFKSAKNDGVGSSIRKLFSFLKNGLGIAFGKVAETANLLDVDFPIRARRGITVDSDWVMLELDSAYKAYDEKTENLPKYKATANVVTVTGAVSPRTEYTSSNDVVVIAKGIPAELRPATHQQFICQGSGMNRWNCSVRTDGTITMSRYGTTAATTVPTTAWIVFCCTYQI